MAAKGKRTDDMPTDAPRPAAQPGLHPPAPSPTSGEGEVEAALVEKDWLDRVIAGENPYSDPADWMPGDWAQDESVHSTRGEAVAAALRDPTLDELAIHGETPVGLGAIERDGETHTGGFQPEDVIVRDVRRESFFVLKFGAGRLPVGLRLGTMARGDVRGASGEISEDERGLVAWFTRLPGDVSFRDGSRVVLRDDPALGYVVETR